MGEDIDLPPQDDWGPSKLEREIVGWALASPVHTVYYKARHRLQPHALLRDLTGGEPLAAGMEVLWALQSLESHGVLEPIKAGYRLTEWGREVGTSWALEE